jgi:hypothetical protein
MAQPKLLGPKLFTLEEAEALLPFIRQRLARFQDLYARFEGCQRDLAVLRLASSSGGNDANPDIRELLAKEGLEKNLLEDMRVIQLEVLHSGCVPKSYQEGLIDFFALKDDRLVFLCWKQGEERIKAWHTLEGGYAGRMPIGLFTGTSPRRPKEEEA